MRKLLLLGVVIAGGVAVARRKAQATASLWREATREGAPPVSRP